MYPFLIAYQFLLAFDLLSSQIAYRESEKGKEISLYFLHSTFKRKDVEVVGIRPYNGKDVWLILFVETKIDDDIFQVFETMSYVTFFDVLF